MRRRPIILLLCATAALVGAAIALADGPATSPAVKALAETPDAQVGPALTVNPAGGSPNIMAVALGTDWRGGSGNPQSAYATGSIVGATGVTTWAPQTILPHTSGLDVGGGSPDVTWGPGNKVYAVELGRDTSAPMNPCAIGAGLYFMASSNGGATWGTPIQLVNNVANLAVSEPSIAYSPVTGRIYIAYTKTDPCSGGAGSTSTVRFMSLPNDVGTGIITNITASPTGLRFAHPSLAVLPNGRVGITYFNDSQSPGSVQMTTCGPSTVVITSAPTCSPDAPVTVDPSASAPASAILGLSVDVRPRIAADATGRVVVTWAKQTAANNMDVFTATSRDAGATFGTPQAVVPADVGGTANEIDPTVAITAGGRADLAFLDTRWDGNAFRVAASSSNTPANLGTVESWTSSVAVEGTPIVPVRPTVPGTPSLGARIAIAEVLRSSGTAWTLIAWTDTRNVSSGTPLNEDVYSTVLLHGTTAPVGGSSAKTVQRNVPTLVPISATDADADPLTYVLAQDGSLGHASISDANQPMLTYTGSKVGTDTVTVTVSDGVQSSMATVTLQVQNSPPVIACGPLSTGIDTPLPIPAGCVSDPNNDPVTLDANTPVHGAIQRPGGVLTFVPTTGFAGQAQVTLTASDGIDAATPQTVDIQVGDPGVTPVEIAGAAARTAFTDRPITLTAAPKVTGADPNKISWSYDNGATYSDWGPTVSHLFPVVGTYTVKARVGNGPPAVIQVFAQTPRLTIKSTDLRNGVMNLRVKLSGDGQLAVGLRGLAGAHKTVKLKRGTRSVHMKLPLAARTRGTVIMKLSLKLAGGGTAKLKRAVLLPAG